MALLRPIQSSFSGGVVSPAAFAALSIERYKKSLKEARNFIIQPDGGAANRPGTRFVARTKYSESENQSAILQEFIFNEEQSYIFEFGDRYVRFYTNGAQVHVDGDTIASWNAATQYDAGDYVTLSGGTVYYAEYPSLSMNPASSYPTWVQSTVYERPTPYSKEHIRDLKFESSADVTYITHSLYQPRTLSRFGATDWRLELFDPDDGPFASVNGTDTTVTPSALTGLVTLTASAAVWSPTDVGSLFKVTHLVSGQKVSSSLSSATSTSSIRAFTTWRIITHGTWTAKFDIEKSLDGGSTWTVIRSFSSVDDFNVDTSGTEDPEVHTRPFLVRVTVTSYTSGTINLDLTSDAFEQDGIGEITTYNNAASVVVNTIADFGNTTATTDWAHGAWSGTRGYPAVSRFFQDRLIFASSLVEPQTIWMSRTGFYDSFRRSPILLDTDGITINLPSRQVNKIKDMVALDRLIVLTTASEWSIGSTSTGVITPLTVDTKVEGYRGTFGVTPIVVGKQIVYVRANGKVIQNLGFEFSSDSFAGEDEGINIYARHLFDKWVITDLAFQDEPGSVIWALRSDGVLLACCFIPSQQMVAWSWNDTGSISSNNFLRDIVESIASIPNSFENFSEVWILVNRENGRMIEKMSLRNRVTICDELQLRMENLIFMDSTVTYARQ